MEDRHLDPSKYRTTHDTPQLDRANAIETLAGAQVMLRQVTCPSEFLNPRDVDALRDFLRDETPVSRETHGGDAA